MNTHKRNFKHALSLVAVILIAATALAFAQMSRVTSSRQETKRVTKLPQITSRVKNIEVVSARVERESEPTAAVVIEIKNNTDKPVIAVTLESGNGKDAYGVTTNGFREGDEPPLVVMEPHGSIAVEMPLSNLTPGEPIKVGGVIYADGTEEGDDVTLKTMRSQKEHYKAKDSKKKGATPQQ